MQFGVLGPVEVRREAGVVALGGVKPRMVIAVLLMHPNEAVHPERLALAIWGEDAPRSAVKTLQVYVSRLRAALGDATILSMTAAGYCLRVEPGELDADRFERLVTEGRRALAANESEQAATMLREALALWRGRPLADLELEGFMQPHIERLEEQRLAAIELRVEADLAVGRHRELVAELRELVAANPTRERFAAQLMLSLYRCGQQTDALDVFQSTRRTLIDEIGVEAAPDLRALQHAILAHDPRLDAAAVTPTAPPDAAGALPAPMTKLFGRERDLNAVAAAGAVALLERDRELERLERSIAAAIGGAGSVVVLEGEAGIGKTALLTHALRVGSRAGMRVLGARGGELERDFAYGIVRQLFEVSLQLASPLARERWLSGAAGLAAPIVSASASGRGSASDPAAVLHGLYWLSANMSSEQPLLLAVDDAHWSDDASIAFLSYLSRRVDELAIVIVYCSRVGEGARDALLALADAATSAAVLRPAPLSAPASAKVVEQKLGRDASAGFALACHTASAGNPFLLGELLRALQQDGIDPDDVNTARVQRIAPDAIARAVLARLRRLGPAPTMLALAVAVLGKSAELRHAAALAQLEAGAAAEAAGTLAAAAILRDGRPLEFIHPVVRTTIYGELSSAKRAAWHKRAAGLLAAEVADDVALAPHLLAAERSGDAWVVERLRAAAQAVLEQAPAAACTYLDRAHREPAPPSDRPALLLELGRAQLLAGRPEAIGHLREVLDIAVDAETRFQAALALVPALVLSGRASEAMTISDEILSSVGPADEELRLRVEGELALVAQFAPRFAKAALERLAAYEGTLTGASSGQRVILTCLAFGAAHGRRSATETARLARLALAGDRLVDEHRPGSAALFLAVWALIYADELHEAERQFDRAIERARKHGWKGEFCGVSGSRCQVLIRQGRLAQAETDALSVLDTQRPHAIARAMLLSCLMHTMIERTDPATWQPFLIEHGLDGDLAEHVMGGILLYSRGHLLLATGDARGALADFERLWQRDELSGQHTPAIPSRAPQALAQLRLGNHDAARTLAADELKAARRWNAPSALAYALRSAALVTGGADGIELLRESVAVAERSPARYEHALSLHGYGAALRRSGRRRDARPPLREALDLADRCGALRLAHRAREELIAAGARPRRSALRGIDALTPGERRVAQLAADGLGNRQIAQALFITVRTVEGHLTNAYTKLDISTRDELRPVLTAPRD